MNFREALIMRFFAEHGMNRCDSEALPLAVERADNLLKQVGNKPNPKPQPMTATQVELQRDNYVQAQRIVGYQTEIANLHNRIQGLAGERLGLQARIDDLEAQLLKAHQGWEQAGRESALNLALAQEAAKKGYRGASAGSRTDWHPL